MRKRPRPLGVVRLWSWNRFAARLAAGTVPVGPGYAVALFRTGPFRASSMRRKESLRFAP